MKINGTEIKGNKFAYDNCHKIYIIEDNEDIEQANEYGYKIYDIKDLESAYENSCDLRFISNWKLDKSYVEQFEENVIFEEI
mgnify:CR=1 FL=1